MPIKHWQFKQQIAEKLLSSRSRRNDALTSDISELLSDNNRVLRNAIEMDHRKDTVLRQAAKCQWRQENGKMCRNNSRNACRSFKRKKNHSFFADLI